MAHTTLLVTTMVRGLVPLIVGQLEVLNNLWFPRTAAMGCKDSGVDQFVMVGETSGREDTQY